MKKRRFVFLLLFEVMLLCMAGCARKPRQIAEKIMLGEHEDVVRARCSTLSGEDFYISYSVYEDFSREEMEALGKAWYENVAGDSGMGGKCSLAFYEGDGDQLLYAFYYTRNGVDTDVKNAYYIPGNKFENFRPEG